MCRWNSTYDMMRRAIKNRGPIEKCSHLCQKYNLVAQTWKKIEELAEVLQPCYELTMKLQFADILPSDAYLQWMETRYLLRKKTDKCAIQCYLYLPFIKKL